MNTKTFPAIALRACLIATLAAAASACVLVGPNQGKSGHDAVVCHKGKKTMTLPQEAVGAHLNHGDHRGAC